MLEYLLGWTGASNTMLPHLYACLKISSKINKSALEVMLEKLMHHFE